MSLIVCLIFLIFSGMVSAGAVLMGEGQGDGEHLRIYAAVEYIEETELPGERDVYIRMTSPICEISGGEAVALGFTVELTEGWSFISVSPCGGAEGMTVTSRIHGAQGNRLKCLLDGIPPEGDDLRLLRVRVSPVGEVVPLRVKVSENGGFYYMGEDGEICSCPLLYGDGFTTDFCTEETDDIHFTDSDVFLDDTSEPPSDDVQPDEETEKNAVSPETSFGTDPDGSWENGMEQSSCDSTEPAPMETLPLPLPEENIPACYIGCQETPVKEGTYAVRFLFTAENEEFPMILVEGGGYLELEITQVPSVEAHVDGHTVTYPGDWWVCTFRGLRQEGHYIFRIYSGSEVIPVRYDGGDFAGHA